MTREEAREHLKFEKQERSNNRAPEIVIISCDICGKVFNPADYDTPDMTKLGDIFLDEIIAEHSGRS